jgi:hypothetical protein
MLNPPGKDPDITLNAVSAGIDGLSGKLIATGNSSAKLPKEDPETAVHMFKAIRHTPF